MTVRTSLLIALILVLSEPFLMAAEDPGGNEVGNGGAIVVCGSIEHGIVIEALDIYEARRIRGLEVDFKGMEQEQDPFVLARYALKRLHGLDPLREARYLETLANFPQEMLMLSDTVFPPTNDTDSFPLPEGCRFEQLIIQKQKTFPEDKKYYVNQEWWNELNPINQAVMILHEIIYEDALRHGHKTSASARYFNSFLFSGAISKVNANAYANLISTMVLNQIRWIDRYNKIVWELSEKNFDTPEEGEFFCQSRVMGLVDLQAVSLGAVEALKGSFIGTYYIMVPDGLLVWARKDQLLTALLLTKQSEDYPKISGPLPALCYSPF